MVQGINRICTIEEGVDPGSIFAGKTKEEVFEKHTGFQPDKKVLISIECRKKTPFGVIGFSTDSPEKACEKGQELTQLTGHNLLDYTLKHFPPEILALIAEKAFKDGDTEAGLAIMAVLGSFSDAAKRKESE